VARSADAGDIGKESALPVTMRAAGLDLYREYLCPPIDAKNAVDLGFKVNRSAGSLGCAA
jgi:hypothetical protein